jgi:putative membrane protein
LPLAGLALLDQAGSRRVPDRDADAGVVVDGGWDMMGTMLIWPVLLLVLAALLVAGVVWAVQLSSRGASRSMDMKSKSADEAPAEILRRRYAGGEISKEQFDEMRRTLGQG